MSKRMNWDVEAAHAVDYAREKFPGTGTAVLDWPDAPRVLVVCRNDPRATPDTTSGLLVPLERFLAKLDLGRVLGIASEGYDGHRLAVLVEVQARQPLAEARKILDEFVPRLARYAADEFSGSDN
jgi:hypothetical protein